MTITVEKYLSEGRHFRNMGYQTDGCSFIGWALNDKYKPACWAHDFARAGFIKVKDQAENDNTFRKALRYLGMSKFRSNLIYYFTRTQGEFKQRFGWGVGSFITAVVWLSVVLFILIGAYLQNG